MSTHEEHPHTPDRRVSNRRASQVQSDQLREANAQIIEASIKAMEAAEVSDLRYHDLIEELDAIIWEADAETGQSTFISRQAEKILGYPVSRWLEEPNFWLTVICPETREQIAREYQNALAAGHEYQIEYRAIASNGRVLWVSQRVRTRRRTDGHMQLFGLIIDMTERKRIEERLSESVRELREAKDKLQEKNDELEKFMDVTVDRELKLIQAEQACVALKRECEILKSELTQLRAERDKGH